MATKKKKKKKKNPRKIDKETVFNLEINDNIILQKNVKNL